MPDLAITVRRPCGLAAGLLMFGAAPAWAEPKLFTDTALGFFLAICLYLAFMAYIIPGLIAWDRRHPAVLRIWAVTLLLGWTGIGWFIAFLWAFSSPMPRAPSPQPPATR